MSNESDDLRSPYLASVPGASRFARWARFLITVTSKISTKVRARKISRRQFAYGLSALGLSLVGLWNRRSSASIFAPDERPTRSFGELLKEAESSDDDAVIEANLLAAIDLRPYQMRPFDRLIRLYGRLRRYDDMYVCLIDGRVRLAGLVRETPSRFQRYRTGLRLIEQRIKRVERIRQNRGQCIGHLAG